MQYNYNGTNPGPEDNGQYEAERLRRKNRILMYTLAAIGLLALGIAAYFLTRGKKEKTKTTTTVTTPAPLTPTIRKDTATVADSARAGGNGEESEEEGEPYGEEFSIANEAYLRTAPSQEGAIAGKVGFGSRVWVDYSASPPSGYKKVYATDPTQATGPSYYVADYVLTSSGEFEDFKKYFSLPPFSGIGTKVKRLILENDYASNVQYEITQNAERAKKTFAYGDFDSDGLTDLAVVLDNNENQESRLLIICTNKTTKEPYLGYASNFSDKIRINSFKKNALIVMYSTTSGLERAPADGVIIESETSKYAVVYDRPNQKFQTYNQNIQEGEDE